MATKSQVVSWMGVAMGVVQSLVKEVQKLGGTDENVRKLVTPEGESLLAELARKLVSTVKLVFSFIPVFDRDMSREGWNLEKDTERGQCGQGEFTPELVEFLKKGEDPVIGTEMERRVKDEPLAGQLHLEAMLHNQERIPVKWRKYILVAPETVWLGSSGGRGVPCLVWGGGRWCLGFGWLGGGFGQGCRVVRLGKYQK